MEYFNIDDFPDYRLVKESEKDFYVESKQKGDWERIGSDDGTGHIYIALCNKGVQKNTHLHVLIGEIFVPNPEGKPIVHHIDFDATNNSPSNLMWVTLSQHRTMHNISKKGKALSEEHRRKLSEANKGERNPMYGKPRPEGGGKPPKVVEQLNIDGTILIKRYDSIKAATRETGVNDSHISYCCNGKRKSAGGYKWRYAD